MKYLFLDTNIYIDMIVSRNKSHTADSYELLKKLLEFNKVKILLPDIIEKELERNLIKEVENIGQKVKFAKAAIDSAYWLNHVEQIELYNQKITPLKMNLGSLNDEFNKNKVQYFQDASDKINNLFENENVVSINSSDELILKIQKRKIFKLCPFHIEGKDSFGDALIVETLINIKDYVTLNSEDQIYFITGNTKDFSDKANKETIHPDIDNDLKEIGINEQVYYRTFYTKTLLNDFKDEIIEAEILEEIIESQIEEEKLRSEIEIQDQINLNRESIGLDSLYDEEYYIEEINNFNDIKDFINVLNLNTTHLIEKIETLNDIYENLMNEIRNIEFNKLESKVLTYNCNSPFLQIDYSSGNVEEHLYVSIESFIRNNFYPIDELQEIIDSLSLSDYFKIGQMLTMQDVFKNKITVKVSGALDPADYGMDYLDIFVEKNNVRLNNSFIKIIYGFAEYDEDGGVADAQDLTIEYNIENVKDDFIEIIEKNLKKLSVIEDNISKLKEILIS